MSYTTPMSQKELVMEAIQELPDNVSVEQISAHVEFIADVQHGLQELDRGEFFTHEEIKREFAAWTAK